MDLILCSNHYEKWDIALSFITVLIAFLALIIAVFELYFPYIKKLKVKIAFYNYIDKQGKCNVLETCICFSITNIKYMKLSIDNCIIKTNKQEFNLFEPFSQKNDENSSIQVDVNTNRKMFFKVVNVIAFLESQGINDYDELIFGVKTCNEKNFYAKEKLTLKELKELPGKINTKIENCFEFE